MTSRRFVRSRVVGRLEETLDELSNRTSQGVHRGTAEPRLRPDLLRTGLAPVYRVRRIPRAQTILRSICSSAGKNHYGSANNNTWSARLSMLRVFASWLRGFDPRNEVPPPGPISGKPRRTRPYISNPKRKRTRAVVIKRRFCLCEGFSAGAPYPVPATPGPSGLGQDAHSFRGRLSSIYSLGR